MATELRIPCSVGEFAAIDFGGEGTPVLAVHELFLQNAAAWQEFADRLQGQVRVVALDREGHGQTRVAAQPAIDLPAAMGEIVEYLGFTGENAPVLLGCGSGGWDVTAATIAGTVSPRGLITTEATYCMPREELLDYVAQFAGTQDQENLWAILDLGWEGTESEMAAERTRLYEAQESSWVLQEIRPDVWRAIVDRSFVPEGDRWIRQPNADALVGLTWERIQQDPSPSAHAFTQLDVPATFIMAEGGLYPLFRDAVDAMVADDPRRKLILTPALYDILASYPELLVDETLAMLAATDPHTAPLARS